ncbi:NAD(P)-binding protein, partial [Mytilinidion resinicola]
MSSSTPPIPHILLLGATGYLGGSILSSLLPNIITFPPNYTIAALVRSPEKAKWPESHNIRPILGSLDDAVLIEEEASKADILINTADSDHLPSARAAVAGLIQRFQETQKKPLYLHTSGTGILISPTTVPGTAEPRIWSDADAASLAAISPTYLHRESDLFLLLPAHASSIHITIVAPSAIHGMGTGPAGFANRLSVQIPWLISNALKLGKMHMVGRGENWNCQVHVADLVGFYGRLLEMYISGSESISELPTGYVF